MLALKASFEDKDIWAESEIIGQSGSYIIIEVDSPPACEYTDLTESNEQFLQRVFDGKFGKTMTYLEFVQIRSLLDELGDYGREAGSLNELKLRKEITDIQLALIEGS